MKAVVGLRRRLAAGGVAICAAFAGVLSFGTASTASARIPIPEDPEVGHYDITWTETDGDSVSYPRSDRSWPTTATESSSPGMLPVWSKNASGSIGQASTEASESGTFKATLTWDGGDANEDPPEVVVIKVETTAQGIGNATHEASCGLDPVQVSSSTATLEYESAYEYRTVTADTDSILVEVECSAKGRSTDPFANNTGSASVSCKITVHVPKVILSGVTTVSGEDKALVGQNVQGSIDLDGLPSTGASYLWSVSGPDIFESYSVAVGGASASLTFHDSSDYDDATMTACFRTAGTANYQCVVTLSGIDPITLDKSAPIEVPANASLTFNKGSIDLDTSGNPALLGAYNLSVTLPISPEYVASGTGMVGVSWSGNVSTPTAFRVSSDAGKAFYVNMVRSSYRTVTENGGDLYGYNSNFTGSPKLDTHYPYELVSIGYFDALGQVQTETDSPTISFDKTTYKAATINDQFTIYYMYRPPNKGLGTNAVALAKQDWSVTGSATKNLSTSVWSLVSGHNVSKGSVVTYPSQPTWSSIATATDSKTLIP